MTNSFRTYDYRFRRPTPALTAAWKEAQAQGIASDLCDVIIRQRPFPDLLAKRLLDS